MTVFVVCFLEVNGLKRSKAVLQPFKVFSGKLKLSSCAFVFIIKSEKLSKIPEHPEKFRRFGQPATVIRNPFFFLCKTKDVATRYNR